MAEICPFSSRTLGFAVAGFGPAGCGFLLHAIKTHAIQDLVDQGLAIIDRAAVPGAGKVGDYQLTGNSLSRAFLDCADDPALAWLFGDLCASHPAVRQLRAMEFDAPPLDVVGDFLRAMAERTRDHLVSEYGVPVLLETEIERIRREENGDYTLLMHNVKTLHPVAIRCRNLISALGGRQSMEVVSKTEILPGVALGETTDKLMVSDDFLTLSDEAIRDAIPLADGTGDVVVLGGSHSAISTIDRLTQALAPNGLKRITMLHEQPLRLYYASAEEARAEGYPFYDPDDVCAMTGRVNRFGGLRYRSLDVAKSILKTKRMPEHDVEIRWLRLRSGDRAEVLGALKEAPAVIACMGYQANLPPVIDSRDDEISLSNYPRGVEVDQQGRVMTATAEPMEGLFAIGIGSTLLRRSEAIGGEASFRGVADGVWLYHNHGGAVVLNALPIDHAKQQNQYAPTDRVANNVQIY